jgi:hypothetical protein
MDGTPTGETVTPAAPSNAPGTTSAPVTDNTSSAELEAARKEAEQAKMRANQLQNQLAEKEAAEAAAKAKQLEEKEEFKTLYEQTQARLKEIEDATALSARQAELKSATDDLFKEYDPKVVELANVAGLSLHDDSDAAKAALKEKLDLFKQQVGPTAPAGSNNPHQPAPVVVDRNELVTRNGEGVSPMALAGAKGDETVIKQYIRGLSAIERMKEIARNGA